MVSGQFTLGSLINFGAIVIATTGFYFNTNYQLIDHAKAIERIDREIVSIHGAIQLVEKSNSLERDKARSDFYSQTSKAADGIAELNKKTAVLEVQLVAINAELVKLGTQLANGFAKTR